MAGQPFILASGATVDFWWRFTGTSSLGDRNGDTGEYDVPANAFQLSDPAGRFDFGDLKGSNPGRSLQSRGHDYLRVCHRAHLCRTCLSEVVASAPAATPGKARPEQANDSGQRSPGSQFFC